MSASPGTGTWRENFAGTFSIVPSAICQVPSKEIVCRGEVGSSAATAPPARHTMQSKAVTGFTGTPQSFFLVPKLRPRNREAISHRPVFDVVPKPELGNRDCTVDNHGLRFASQPIKRSPPTGDGTLIVNCVGVIEVIHRAAVSKLRPVA